ncbi:MAG: hypothetical protein HKN30_17105 [Sulfitobacter sp.]|nr:hypothetical protein [Sulfitobacter sp.]
MIRIDAPDQMDGRVSQFWFRADRTCGFSLALMLATLPKRARAFASGEVTACLLPQAVVERLMNGSRRFRAAVFRASSDCLVPCAVEAGEPLSTIPMTGWFAALSGGQVNYLRTDRPL